MRACHAVLCVCWGGGGGGGGREDGKCLLSQYSTSVVCLPVAGCCACMVVVLAVRLASTRVVAC